MSRVVLAVGTKRGLFLFESNAKRTKWTQRGPFLKGWSIYHTIVDTRGTPRVHAAASNFAFSCHTFSGDVRGKSWKAAKKPPVPPKLLPSHMKWIRKWSIPTEPRVWHIEPGPAKQKKVLYAGTAPAALFRSEDSGKTWREMKGLTNHPTRRHWMPGAAGMCTHSIQIDASNPKRMYVGISAAGAFRSDNSGRSWKPINAAVKKFIGAPKDGQVGT